MDLSIIISTWNNQERLKITLDTIFSCTIPHGLKWELIIVNNNCSDDTDMVINGFTSKLPIVYIKEPIQGLSRARNKGLSVAKGDLIIFSDDDVRPSKEWVYTYWKAFREKQKGFYFGGPVESEFEYQKPDSQLLKFAPYSVRGLNLGERARVLDDSEMFIGANWACPVYALKTIGYFDIRKGLNPSSGEIRVGEERELLNRLKNISLLPYYLPRAKIVHYVPTKKCNFRHIANRTEANGYDHATEKIDDYRNYPAISGIPRWIYRKMVSAYMKWTLSKLKRKKNYAAYFSFRYMLGTAKGLHDCISAQQLGQKN